MIAPRRLACALTTLALCLPNTACLTIELLNSAAPKQRAGDVTGVLAWRSPEDVQVGVFYENQDPRGIALEFVSASDEEPAMTLAEWRDGVDPNLEPVPVLQRMPLSKELDVVVWSKEEERVRLCRGDRCHPGPNLYCWPKSTIESRMINAAWLLSPISAVLDLVIFPYQFYLLAQDRMPERIEADCP